jgi:hypothetical protein
MSPVGSQPSAPAQQGEPPISVTIHEEIPSPSSSKQGGHPSPPQEGPPVSPPSASTPKEGYIPIPSPSHEIKQEEAAAATGPPAIEEFIPTNSNPPPSTMMEEGELSERRQETVPSRVLALCTKTTSSSSYSIKYHTKRPFWNQPLPPQVASHNQTILHRTENHLESNKSQSLPYKKKNHLILQVQHKKMHKVWKKKKTKDKQKVKVKVHIPSPHKKILKLMTDHNLQPVLPLKKKKLFQLIPILQPHKLFQLIPILQPHKLFQKHLTKNTDSNETQQVLQVQHIQQQIQQIQQRSTPSQKYR